jgi:hypothetical protein
MEIPRQQALDLLREWQRKKCIMQGGLMDSLGNNAAVYGCIQTLDDHEVRIDARDFAKKAATLGIIIRLDQGEFSFGKWPETPPKSEGEYQFGYESFLIVTFPNGSRCELYVTNL